jgi:hypothetical protein
MSGRQFHNMSRISALFATHYLHPVLNQQVGHCGDIGENGYVPEDQGLRSQQRRGHQGQSSVFRTADRDYAFERHAADYANLVHCLDARAASRAAAFHSIGVDAAVQVLVLNSRAPLKRSARLSV